MLKLFFDINWNHNQCHQPWTLTIYFEKTNLNCSFYWFSQKLCHSQESLSHRLPKALVCCCCGVKHKCKGEASNRMPKAVITGPSFMKRAMTTKHRRKLQQSLKGRSYQVKCSVKWIWKTQLCEISDKAMDLSEKNVVLLFFPGADLYLEYCLARPGLTWPQLHSATLEQGPLMVNAAWT